MENQPGDDDFDLETHELGSLDAARLLTLGPDTNKLILKGSDAGAVIDLTDRKCEELAETIEGGVQAKQ